MKKAIIVILLVVLVAVGYWYHKQQQILPVVDDTLPSTSDRYISTQGFSIGLPEGYTADDLYQYQLNPTEIIRGTKFIVPTSLADETNLGADSGVSVEQIPNSTSCTADLFLDGDHEVLEQTEEGTKYSVAFASNAGAGNRYEETVYAFVGTNPCVAVRYFIHYSVFENYPAGSIKEFNKAALVSQFDNIRRTLVVD